MRRAAHTLILMTFVLSCCAPSHAQTPVAEEASTLDLPKPPEDKADWEPSGELAALLEKLTDASKSSREVFQPLSATQMNWRPPNGTHTPRWNAEHLSATHLGLFSSAFAAIDPDHHKAVRINPKQMPDDYQPAHPDWSGAEQASQMKEIADYVNGFAYLLESKDLTEPLPNGRWPLKRMFEIIAGHYDQHTANVRKKFELEGWPAE